MGTPEELAEKNIGFTAPFLKEELEWSEKNKTNIK